MPSLPSLPNALLNRILYNRDNLSFANVHVCILDQHVTLTGQEGMSEYAGSAFWQSAFDVLTAWSLELPQVYNYLD